VAAEGSIKRIFRSLFDDPFLSSKSSFGRAAAGVDSVKSSVVQIRA
jgi:hypothetical protein